MSSRSWTIKGCIVFPVAVLLLLTCLASIPAAFLMPRDPMPALQDPEIKPLSPINEGDTRASVESNYGLGTLATEFEMDGSMVSIYEYQHADGATITVGYLNDLVSFAEREMSGQSPEWMTTPPEWDGAADRLRVQQQTINVEPLITLQEFNDLETGMSYDEVVEIIGSPGERIARINEITTYLWYGHRVELSNATITFENGRLKTKEQTGLE